jgi:SWIM/SEC-C metal-binding protein
MSKLGTKSKPAVVKVQTEGKAIEIMTLCDAKGWQVIVGIEPDEPENIDDIRKLEAAAKPALNLTTQPSRNAPCPCGSGKQYKRCCDK